MLYGAYGRTGRLILDEALRRGHRPLLAGRDAAQIEALGQATGLDAIHLPLDNAATLRTALSGVSTVLLAAGPYHQTGPLMRAACIDAGCSYLDINGELEDFTQALAADAAARAAGIAIIPGAGYGVIFGESLAVQVARRAPGATWLRLSLATQTDGHSRGADLSVAAAMSAGGHDIYQGALRRRPIASPTWRAPSRDGGRGMAFAGAPLAEVIAAHRSTGIPNVSAGIPMSRIAAAFVRVAGPLLGAFMARFGGRGSTASEAKAMNLQSRIWAEAGNTSGTIAAAMLETGEGYQAAAFVAMEAVEQHLREPRVGALTPVQAFGADLALRVPGTRIQEL
jgi:short subunit dehydrogenase-like uncharacterized protein